MLTITSNADATRPVVHTRHIVDETFIRAALQLTKKHEPAIHVDYMGSTHLGESSLCSSGWIPRLASLDRARFNAFVASCDGLIKEGVVTSLKGMCLVEDVPILPGDVSNTACGMMTCTEKGDVHMNAEFPGGIDLSQTGRCFVVTLKCKGYAHKIITLTGAQIYTAFLERCQRNARWCETTRKIIHATSHVHVRVNTTQVAGHKVWIHDPQEPKSFITVYFARRRVIKKSRMREHICVVALDIRANMHPSDGEEVDRSRECVICMSVMTDLAWTCATCKNSMHEHCMATWKVQDSSCPFCRCAID
jgi:hypothetical protein